MVERNLDPNPSGANNTAGCTPTAGTLSRVTSGLGSWLRPTAIRLTTNNAAVGYSQIERARHVPGVSVAGRPFSAVLQWSTSSVPGAFYFALLYHDSSGTYFTNSIVELTGISPNTPRVDVVTGVAPAGTFQVSVGVLVYGTPNGWTLTTGLCRIDEVNDPNITPADGGSPGWSWDGTAGSSSSTGPSGSPLPAMMMLINEPPTPAAIQHNLAGVPDGPLVAADTGQPYTLTTSGAGAAGMVVRNGAIGPPAGWTPPGNVTAGYAHLPLGASCTWVGGMLRFDAAPSNSDDASACIGAFNTPGYQEGSTNAPIHLSIAPAFFQFSVFTGGVGDYTTLAPLGGGSSTVALASPLPCDGVTQTRCDVTLDRAVNRARVTIGTETIAVFEDPRIGQSAAWPFWEYYCPPDHVNVPRFTKVWAGTDG